MSSPSTDLCRDRPVDREHLHLRQRKPPSTSAIPMATRRTPVLVHNDGGGAYPIDLGGGYWGRMDRFPAGQGTDFEIHVVRGGSEVGVFGSNGWFSKHGLDADVSVPGTVANRLKGISVKEMRASGRLGAKGTMDITGDKWKRPRLGGAC